MTAIHILPISPLPKVPPDALDANNLAEECPIEFLYLSESEFRGCTERTGAIKELSVATGVAAVIVELDPTYKTRASPEIAAMQTVVVGVARDHPIADQVSDWVDVLLVDCPSQNTAAVAPIGGIERGLAILLGAIERAPTAATALAMLLRGASARSTTDGLLLESLTYSVMQAGPEFRAWLGSANRRSRSSVDRQAISVNREGERLVISLMRPELHNAFNSVMRDELIEAFTLASNDPTIRKIVLQGEGPSFCSGGDLSEFGTFNDPANAHMIRTTRSVARLMVELRDRLQVRVHGACIGAGIELAAFAGHVTATPGTYIALPELSMGLIPGAGGTVSITRRVGRHRTAWLALSGVSLDAATAHKWGLVDEVGDSGEPGDYPSASGLRVSPSRRPLVPDRPIDGKP